MMIDRPTPLLLVAALVAPVLVGCGDDSAGGVPDLREPGDSKAGQPPPAETFQMRNRGDYTIAYPVECAGDFCRPSWLELGALQLDDPCNCICGNPLSCDRPCAASGGIERRMLAPGAVAEFSWTGRHYEDMGNREPEGPRGERCLNLLQLSTGDSLDATFCWYPSATLMDVNAEQECATVVVSHMEGQVVGHDVTCEGDDCAPRPLEPELDAGR